MRGAVEHLKGLEEVNAEKIGALGFCLGGRLS
ncbi:MAG: dienelactone hydrolase family protein [Nitrospinota bacterium]|jgi:dienelactone hydrolase|nr:dienelactone hydrolase family protein [Nitrospinota bacterium]